MSLGRVSAVGTVGGERSRALRLEREADDRAREERLNAPVKAKIDELAQEAAKTAGRVVAEEKRFEIQTLKYDLAHAPCPEFYSQCKPYDNRFAGEQAKISQAVEQAGKACLAANDLDEFSEGFKTLVALITANGQYVDPSIADHWNLGWQFLVKKFAEIDAKYEAPAPEPTPVIELTAVEKHRASLIAKRDACPPSSDSYRKADRELMLWDVKDELILQDSDGIRPVLEEIISLSGLAIPASCNIAYRQWKTSPLQVRRYTNSREDVMLSFAEFTGDSSWLPQEMKNEVDRRKRVGSLTSDQVKAIVGDNTHSLGYDPGRRG